MSYTEDLECESPSYEPSEPPTPLIRKLFLSNDQESSDHCHDTFQVFVRIKPTAKTGTQNDCIKMEGSTKLVCEPPSSSKYKKVARKEFKFSHILGPETTQDDVFSKCVVDRVRDLLLGRSSVIFAYGTTNAGKTFTVQGNPEEPGIIPQVFRNMFSNIEIDTRNQYTYKPYMARDIESSTSQEEFYAKNEILNSFRSHNKYSKSAPSHVSDQFNQIFKKDFMGLDDKPTCSVWISFVEIYNEMIYDLLDSSRESLKLATDKYDNFYVKGLRKICVSSAEEAFAIYQFGKTNLNVASNKLNENSSRSHCILTLYVINLSGEKNPSTVSKLCICDLAGTERLTNTENTGQRKIESNNINTSLFQLNRCLRTIRNNQIKRSNDKIPYRYSKLTKLLQSALDNRTDEQIIMIVNVNPSVELYDETQEVLRLSAIASMIKNKPIVCKLRRKSRLAALIHDKDDIFPFKDQANGLSVLEEENSEEDSNEPDPQGMKAKLMRAEEELDQLGNYVKIRQIEHEKTMQCYKDYCDKVKNTYEKRVKCLEERLEKQKKRYISQINCMKKNTLLESTCSCNGIGKEELSEKDAIIDKLERKLLESTRDDLRNLSLSEEMNKKEVRIQDLELLVDEAKKEYLFFERMHTADKAKLTKLEDELNDKNGMIQNLENELYSKQNFIEELEEIIDGLKESMSRTTIEIDRIFIEQEAIAQKERFARNEVIKNLNLKIESLDQEVEELRRKNKSKAKTDSKEKTRPAKTGSKEKTKPYNTRRNNRIGVGKENLLLDEEVVNKTSKKGTRGRPKKTPLVSHVQFAAQ